MYSSQQDTIMLINKTCTRSPGESSVYSLSIVPDEPPAPAAREELGFGACEPAARRLVKQVHSVRC